MNVLRQILFTWTSLKGFSTLPDKDITTEAQILHNQTKGPGAYRSISNQPKAESRVKTWIIKMGTSDQRSTSGHHFRTTIISVLHKRYAIPDPEYSHDVCWRY